MDGREFSKTYKTAALADTRRSALVTAQRKGEVFDPDTGLPPSLDSKNVGVDWYVFAVEYVEWKWSRVGGHSRVALAKAMTAATMAMLRRPLPTEFVPARARTALREWAFNIKRRTDEDLPEDIRCILEWVQRNTLPVSALDDEDRRQRFIGALSTLLSGKPAAPSSVRRNRRIMTLPMEQAVSRGLLSSNPIPRGRGEQGTGKGKGGAPSAKAVQAVDKRSLLNNGQVDQLLEWIGNRPRMGRCYRAFFATLFYAGLRPEEAVGLRVKDVTRPEEGFGELLVHAALPEVGGHWTDTGSAHERRGLKGRPQGDTRPVPANPQLVAILGDLIEEYDLEPGDILFQGENGGLLAGSVYRRVWGKARRSILPEHEANSPVGKRVYDLRHTCLTAWLNGGIPPAQVAEWAGNSVPVLQAVYARCVVGQRDGYQKMMERAQTLRTAAQ